VDAVGVYSAVKLLRRVQACKEVVILKKIKILRVVIDFDEEL